jgi:hypothetical protein
MRSTETPAQAARRHCSCGHALSGTNVIGRCFRCNARKRIERHADLPRKETLARVTSLPDSAEEPLRAERIPIYAERAAKGLPLFDPSLSRNDTDD